MSITANQSKKERLVQIAAESEKLQSRQRALYEEIQSRQRALYEESRTIRLELAKEEYPCSCVKLNKDIEIYDCTEQDRRGRKGIGVGLVGDCLSARYDCSECEGTGVPH